MNRPLKIVLIALGSLLVVAVVIALGGWFYFKSTFLDFEKDYENQSFKEITIDGYTFLDRNNNGSLDIYEDSRRPASERVDDLLAQMTMDEKLRLLKGSGIGSAMGRLDEEDPNPGVVGTIVPISRLGIPAIFLSDGPAGLRIPPTREGRDGTFYCTAFPIATLLASTWNEELVYEVGNAMGKEALEYGVDVILGPGANIHRHPFCGRNFEYYSEDPVLTGYIGAAMVNGIESNGVGATPKHFVANNQETNRNFNDVLVSERAMREIYLKGFEIIVKESQPWTIMSSYNLVNGTYTPESRYLLTEVLRDDWNFEGLVMTDWFGGNDAPAMISAGNDLLEPGTKKQWNALIEAQKSGKLSTEVIDTSVRRILTLIMKSKKMQNYEYGNNPDLDAHAKITRQSASEGMVLLENDGTLPIDDGLENVALLGVTSYEFIAGGTGSGDVNEAYTISLEEGLRNAGYQINAEAQALYTAHRAANEEDFKKPEGMNAMFEPYNPPQIPYTIEELEGIATSADIGVITIGRNSGEGGDRVIADDFLLTKMEMDMIENACQAFHGVGKKVVVVGNVGGGSETASWRSKPDAVLLAWQGGQEGGNSVAEILSGQVNPSGKLTMTFPIKVEDHASHENFPLEGKPMEMTSMLFGRGEKTEEEKIPNEDYTRYEEGIYVGYRHFDKVNLDVSYPFGFGLSYSEFDYSDFTVTVENDTIMVTANIMNTGSVPGKEIVQVYVAKTETMVDRPIQELKAFVKTDALDSGQVEQVNFKIPVQELSYWDENASDWMLEAGNYEVRLGASSRDIRAQGIIYLNGSEM
jgi:beta-glucosidase